MSDAIESRMMFSKPDGSYLKIEDCQPVPSLSVKSCDFLILRESRSPKELFIIEAKSSAPRPGHLGGDVERWDDYIDEIFEKLLNGLMVFIGLKVGRPYRLASELPIHMRGLNFSDLLIKPCLVLRDHPEHALPPVSDALKARFAPIVKCFCLIPPLVINSSMAIKHGLVERLD